MNFFDWLANANLNLYLFSIKKVDIFGWLATFINASAFFFKERTLKLILLIGSLVWVIYGISIESMPIIVANAILIVSILTSFLTKKA